MITAQDMKVYNRALKAGLPPTPRAWYDDARRPLVTPLAVCSGVETILSDPERSNKERSSLALSVAYEHANAWAMSRQPLGDQSALIAKAILFDAEQLIIRSPRGPLDEYMQGAADRLRTLAHLVEPKRKLYQAMTQGRELFTSLYDNPDGGPDREVSLMQLRAATKRSIDIANDILKLYREDIGTEFLTWGDTDDDGRARLPLLYSDTMMLEDRRHALNNRLRTLSVMEEYPYSYQHIFADKKHLKDQLKRAVQEENFELVARVRDEISAMSEVLRKPNPPTTGQA